MSKVFTKFEFKMVLISGDYGKWKEIHINIDNLGGRNLKYWFDDETKTKLVRVEYCSHKSVLNAIIKVCQYYKDMGFVQEFAGWTDDRHWRAEKALDEIHALV